MLGKERAQIAGKQLMLTTPRDCIIPFKKLVYLSQSVDMVLYGELWICCKAVNCECLIDTGKYSDEMQCKIPSCDNILFDGCLSPLTRTGL